MKKQWNGFISGALSVMLLLGLVGTAFAAVGKQTVEVDYNDIKITMNGQMVNLVDANGNAVEPFAINGTTYLPVRAVASALGLDVGWDGKTSTVVLETSKQLTLNFSFGERTGIYSGSVNDAGLPDGQGTFTANNDAGESWTYSGSWKNGHFSGAGTATWNDGQINIGIYENDGLCGPGMIRFSDGTIFSGTFFDNKNATGTYTKENGDISYAEMKDGEITYY